MDKLTILTFRMFVLSMCLFNPLQFNGMIQIHNISITIHVHGIYKTKIFLLHTNGFGTFKPIIESRSAQNGQTIKLSVAQEYLSGEFVLRFEFKDKENSTPYPCEKHFF